VVVAVETAVVVGVAVETAAVGVAAQRRVPTRSSGNLPLFDCSD
jgi:hypothetical protein